MRALVRDERGQDIMEYGMLAAFLAIAAVATARAIGLLLVPPYESVADAVMP